MEAGSAEEEPSRSGVGEGTSFLRAGGVRPLKGRGLRREPPLKGQGGASQERGEASETRVCGVSPAPPGQLGLFFAGSTGVVSTFSPGCACGGGTGGEGAATPRNPPGACEAQPRGTDRGRSGSPLLVSCQCRVAPQLGASAGAEAGTSARPDELSVKRPGPCPPALGSRPPSPQSRRHCPASRCIKDLNRSHRAALLTLPPLPPFGLGAPLHACFS